MSSVYVGCATRTGSTIGVAEAIAAALAAMGHTVQVGNLRDANGLQNFQAYVLGSPIRSHQWLPEALAFLRDHQAVLANRPVALFTTCITLSMGSGPQYQSAVREWTAQPRALVHPAAEGYFAGTLELSKVGGVWTRFQMSIPVWMKLWKEGDHRDWGQINAWARELPARLNLK